jgi:hypothetical protein
MLADVAVFKDYGVDDLSAENASPPEEILSVPVKLLIGHNPTAPVAFHSIDLLKQNCLWLSKFCTT